MNSANVLYHHRLTSENYPQMYFQHYFHCQSFSLLIIFTDMVSIRFSVTFILTSVCLICSASLWTCSRSLSSLFWLSLSRARSLWYSSFLFCSSCFSSSCSLCLLCTSSSWLCSCVSLWVSSLSRASHSLSLRFLSSAWAACCFCRLATSCRCFSRLRCFSCSMSELGRDEEDDDEEEDIEGWREEGWGRSVRACRWSSMKVSCWMTTAYVRDDKNRGCSDASRRKTNKKQLNEVFKVIHVCNKVLCACQCWCCKCALWLLKSFFADNKSVAWY